MQHSRVAGRYALSLIGLAQEKDTLEAVHQDVLFLQRVCGMSPEFMNVLRSPVINPGKKEAILEAIGKNRVGPLTLAFARLLVRKGREGVLPEIIQAFVNQYNELKGIHVVKLTTALSLDEKTKKTVAEKVRKDLGWQHVVLESLVDADLLGGFTLEFGDQMVDASVSRELENIRRTLTGAVYTTSIN